MDLLKSIMKECAAIFKWLLSIFPKRKLSGQTSNIVLFSDDFKQLDSSKWGKCVKGASAWDKNKSQGDGLFQITSDGIRMMAVKNEGECLDESVGQPYLTAGLTSKNKFSFATGRIDVVARMHNVQGSWHAIWLYGSHNTHDGVNYAAEIDLSECLNHNRYTYQNFHSDIINANGGMSKKADLNPEEWNTYSAEVTAEYVKLYINGKQTHEYANAHDGTYRFADPDNPLYIIIDSQIDGSWAGTVDDAELPSWIEVKSVAVSEIC